MNISEQFPNRQKSRLSPSSLSSRSCGEWQYEWQKGPRTHEDMRSTSPEPDERNLNYTLSLAAVKSGFFDAMANPVVSTAESSDGYGYEIESRQDVPTVNKSRSEGGTERETQTEVRVVESGDGSADILTLEVDETGTVESSVYKTLSYSGNSSVKSKVRGAKKKISRFVRKSRNKLGTALLVDEKPKPTTAPSVTSFNIGPVSTGASTVSDEPIRYKDAAKETIITMPEDSTKEVVKPRLLPPLAPLPPPPPPKAPATAEKPTEEQKLCNEATPVATNRGESHQEESYKMRSQDQVEKATKRLDVLLSTDSYETDYFSESQRRETDGEGDSFTMSKVSDRTYIINESGSFVGESWSRDEQPSGGYGCFSCACGGGGPKDEDEWEPEEEEEDDDETVQSDSEEGRVADAVITIQEHAERLGLTEYELLEMIQDE